MILIVMLSILFVLLGVGVICLFFWFNHQIDSNTFEQGILVTGLFTVVIAIVGLALAYKLEDRSVDTQETIIRHENADLKVENNKLLKQIEELEKK